MDTIFWDDSGGGTFCQRCGGCAYNTFINNSRVTFVFI